MSNSRSVLALLVRVSALVSISQCHALRASLAPNDDCGRAIRQVYEAQVPERMCGAMVEDKPWAAFLSGNTEPDVPRHNFWPERPKHKNLFPLNVKDLLTWTLAVVTLAIAAGGGIGGGGVLVPLYILCWGFETEHAVALSNLTIAGGSFANLWCNIDRRHPAADRPLIYWDMIMVMEPATIVGAVFGGFLNKLLPVWLTTILLAGLLMVMAQQLWQKAASLFQKESLAMNELALRSNPEDCDIAPAHRPLGPPDEERGAMCPLLQHPNKQVIDRIIRHGDALAATESPLFAEAREILLAEAEKAPLPVVLTLAALFVWLVCADTLKDAVTCGGVTFWLLVLSILPVVAVVMASTRRSLIHKGVVKQQVGVVPQVGDIVWTPYTTIVYPLLCSGAGVIAGMFGVGGGIVKGPLMLQLGILPDVAAATSATMILFTSCSASVVYITFGGVKWDYAILMIVTGFVVTLGGQMLTYYVIERHGRKSVVVLAMAILLTAGAGIMCYEVFPALGRAQTQGFLHGSSICL